MEPEQVRTNGHLWHKQEGQKVLGDNTMNSQKLSDTSDVDSIAGVPPTRKIRQTRK